MEEIIGGTLASLVATIVWVFATKLYDYNGRRTIALLLNQLYDSAESFDSAIVFSQPTIAEVQCDRIIQHCTSIFHELKPLTYSYHKRKLFFTLLYNAYYTITYYKRIAVGYEGDDESDAKLEKFARKYYYSVPIFDFDGDFGNEPQTRSFLMVTVTTLQSLNAALGVKKALSNTLLIDESNVYKAETYRKLVQPTNLKYKWRVYKNARDLFERLQKILLSNESDNSGQSKCERVKHLLSPFRHDRYDLKRSCFSFEEYNAYIAKQFKKEAKRDMVRPEPKFNAQKEISHDQQTPPTHPQPR